MSTRTHAEPKPVAETFTPAKSGLLQRKCACGGSAGLTGQCAGCDEERLTLQRHSANQFEPSAVPAIPPIVHDVLRSPGQSLDGDIRAFMDSRFGHDFSRVRLHTDARAVESVQMMDVMAYTVGHDIIFGAGQYAPGTSQGLRLMAHELTHVVQQRRSSGGSTGAEPRARIAAARVARGGLVTPDAIGEAPLGVYTDDGKETGLSASDSQSFKLGGPPLMGPLKVSAWLIDELIKQGQLSPQMLQLIQSGQIEIQPGEKSAPGAIGGISNGTPSGTPGGGTRNFATEFNTLPNQFFSPGSARLNTVGSDPLSGPQVIPAFPPTPQSVPVGGYLDPLIGYIPRHIVKWTPPPPSAPQAPGQPNWLQQSLADLKTSFAFSEGLTISSISQPGIITSIFLTGITQRVKTPGGLGVQTELGWDKSVGLQLSYRDWFLHGSLDMDGKWGLTLSFPNDVPVPIAPWVNDIFHEGGMVIRGFAGAAAAGPPNLNNLDPLIKQLTPHINRMKSAIDAAKGIAKAQPGVSVALTVGPGPRPGAVPSDMPSGIFLGGTIVGTF